MPTYLTCIVCPRGCHLEVDDELNVKGNFCPRGAVYGKSEVSNPVRTLTSTVKLVGSKEFFVLPVKTAAPIPKGKIMEAMEEVNKVEAKVPVRRGDTLLENIASSGVALIATRDVLE